MQSPCNRDCSPRLSVGQLKSLVQAQCCRKRAIQHVCTNIRGERPAHGQRRGLRSVLGQHGEGGGKAGDRQVRGQTGPRIWHLGWILTPAPGPWPRRPPSGHLELLAQGNFAGLAGLCVLAGGRRVYSPCARLRHDRSQTQAGNGAACQAPGEACAGPRLQPASSCDKSWPWLERMAFAWHTVALLVPRGCLGLKPVSEAARKPAECVWPELKVGGLDGLFETVLQKIHGLPSGWWVGRAPNPSLALPRGAEGA